MEKFAIFWLVIIGVLIFFNCDPLRAMVTVELLILVIAVIFIWAMNNEMSAMHNKIEKLADYLKEFNSMKHRVEDIQCRINDIKYDVESLKNITSDMNDSIIDLESKISELTDEIHDVKRNITALSMDMDKDNTDDEDLIPFY